jgi:UDP-2-acetamido-3-amino-2,3-dideoxy-glucuronate N-acetyltransferase
MDMNDFFVHESSFVDEKVTIGKGSRIWHFSHVLSGAKIGEHCTLGQNVCISGDVVIGNHVKIQNNVSVYDGTCIEDHVFLGPSCVLTNVTNPRSEISRKDLYEKTVIKKGATIGANATVLCGVTIGRYAFAAAGAVITTDIPDYTLVMGIPAKPCGWISRHGHRLDHKNKDGFYICPESGFKYRETREHTLVCVDLDDDHPLPKDLKTGTMDYHYYKTVKKD